MNSKTIRFILLLVIAAVLLYFNFFRDSYEKDKAAIMAVMEQQAVDWSEGDIEGYMSGYWKSDQFRFMGQRGITYGWQQQLDNYKKGYPDKDAMGHLTFEYISFDQMGEKNMFVVGKWKLERKDDSPGGYFSLVWEKIDGEWKIIFDHTP